MRRKLEPHAAGCIRKLPMSVVSPARDTWIYASSFIAYIWCMKTVNRLPNNHCQYIYINTSYLLLIYKIMYICFTF